MVGIFRVSLKVTSPEDIGFNNPIEIKAWVDTGATYTQIPSSILTKLGIKVFRVKEFILADGRIITRKIGNALLEVHSEQTYNEVIFGEDNAEALLGSFTLETTGLLVDPLNEKLYRRKGGIIQYSLIFPLK